MIETKPRINRGNRGQLFRAGWLDSDIFRSFGSFFAVTCCATPCWREPTSLKQLSTVAAFCWFAVVQVFYVVSASHWVTHSRDFNYYSLNRVWFTREPRERINVLVSDKSLVWVHTFIFVQHESWTLQRIPACNRISISANHKQRPEFFALLHWEKNMEAMDSGVRFDWDRWESLLLY